MANHQVQHEDSYFIDQVCMVALTGAFGVVCLSMYFLRQEMLYRLLGRQFHLFVLASGIALVLIALVRASVLWYQAGLLGNEAGTVQPTCCHDESPAPPIDAAAHTHSHGEHSHAPGDHAHSH